MDTIIDKVDRRERFANVKEMFFKCLFLACAIFSIVAVLGIFFFLLWEGVPAIRQIGFFRFVFGRTWRPNREDQLTGEILGSYGIFNMIMGSVFATVGAIMLGGTMGVLAAIFLSKFCPRKIKPALTQSFNLLAGIPSVVFGFFAMRVLLPARVRMSFFGLFDFPPMPIGLGIFSSNLNGTGLLAVSIILAIMITPITVAISRSSIDAVDPAFYEGALALGASKPRAVFNVVVPAAKSGIFAAVILGLGRAIGETMAVVMAQGGSATFPPGLFGSFRVMTAHIVMEQGYAEGLQRGGLIATGLVLLFFVLIINICFNYIKNGKKGGQGLFGTVGGYCHSVCNVVAGVKKQEDLPVDAIDVFGRRDFCISGSASIDKIKIKEKKVSQKSAAKEAKLEQKRRRQEELILKKPPKEADLSLLGVVVPRALMVMAVIAASVAAFFLFYIVFFVLSNGVHHISWGLLFGEFAWGGNVTLFSSIISTFMVIFLASLITFPLGIFTAIYLVEYTKKGSKLVAVIRLAIETLAGIPSIIFGLFGMILFAGLFGWGMSLLGGALTVSIMSIPVTVRATEEALMSVPQSYREGSYALGAGKIRTIFRVVLPSAIPGIFAAVLLGIGRMIAETAALVFTAGSTMRAIPDGYMNAGTTLAVALFSLASEGLHVNEAFATASILIIIVLTLNILATVLVSRIQRKILGTKKAVKKQQRTAV